MFYLARPFLRLSPIRYVKPRKSHSFPFHQPLVSQRQRSPLLSTLFKRTYTSKIEMDDPQIDWNNLDKHTIHDLPDDPSDEKLLEMKKYFMDMEKKLSEGDLSQIDVGVKDVDLPHYKLKRSPLVIVSDVPDHKKRLILSRYTEEMRLYEKYAKFDDIINAFVEVRKEQVHPTLEMYEQVIPILVLIDDHASINMLIEEMDSLGYQKGEKIYFTLLIKAMNVDNKPEVDKVWQEIINRKFEVNSHIYKLVLTYLTHRPNLEEVVDWYYKMRKLGVIEDANPAYILLEMCLSNKFYDLAHEIIADVENDGHLLLDDKKDLKTFNYKDESLQFYPKQSLIVETCLLISEIYTNQHNIEKSQEYYTKAKNIFEKHNTTKDKLKPSYRYFESIIDMYSHYNNYEKIREVLQGMLDEEFLPSFTIWKKALLSFINNDQSRLFLNYVQHFESLGFEFDEFIYSAQLRMWYRCGDYRRARNTYELIIQNGMIPSKEATEAIAQVFAKAGFPDDVQKFYEEQLRSGRPMTPTIHTIMIEDHLKRGKADMAMLVLQRMRNEGYPADLKTFVKVLRGSSMQEIKKLISEYVYGPKPIYSMNAEILTEIIIKCPNLENAIENWKNLGSLVKLDAISGRDLLQFFGKLFSNNIVMEIYEKTKQDSKFEPSDFAFFEAAIMTSSNIPQINQILEDMKQYGIKKSRSLYLTIMAKCSDLHRPREALLFILDYLKSNENLPLHSDVIFSFFEVIANHDYGIYREDALRWTQTILQSKMDSLHLPNQDTHDSLLQPNQVVAVLQYIHNMSPDLIIPSWVYPTEEGLFQPSLKEIEDILVHQYGYEREAVQDILAEQSLVGKALTEFKDREKEILAQVKEKKRVLHETMENKEKVIPNVKDLSLWNLKIKSAMEQVFQRLSVIKKETGAIGI